MKKINLTDPKLVNVMTDVSFKIRLFDIMWNQGISVPFTHSCIFCAKTHSVVYLFTILIHSEFHM